MAVIISEIVTEVVAKGGAEDTAAAAAPAAGQPSAESVELIVRMAVERVLEVLRREWDR